MKQSQFHNRMNPSLLHNAQVFFQIIHRYSPESQILKFFLRREHYVQVMNFGFLIKETDESKIIAAILCSCKGVSLTKLRKPF